MRKPRKTPQEARERLEALPRNSRGCWVWRGRTSEGYGTMQVERKRGRTHRWAYELFIGPIPGVLCVLHTCDNQLCCNPGHLILGTRAQNMAEMYERERQSTSEQRRTFGNRRLTEKDVKQIDQLYGDGYSQQWIASAFGLTQTGISRILRRETWKHIPRKS